MELIGIGLLFLAVLNILTYFVFRFDKLQAVHQERRVRERTMLWLAALGGSIAAKVAQHRLNHKTHRRRFSRLVNAFVVVHVLLVCLVVAEAANVLPTLASLQ